MPVFDTSALVPLFITRHPAHGQAQELFDRADAVILHPCVIAEFTTVMRRLAKDRGLEGNLEARTALQALIKQPRVLVRADLDHEAAIQAFLADGRISFTDAVVAQSRDPVSVDGDVLRHAEGK